MARYCFYCGRELSSGEKCQCRTQGAATGSSSAGGAGPANTTAGGTAGPAGSDRQPGATNQASGGGTSRATGAPGGGNGSGTWSGRTAGSGGAGAAGSTAGSASGRPGPSGATGSGSAASGKSGSTGSGSDRSTASPDSRRQADSRAGQAEPAASGKSQAGQTGTSGWKAWFGRFGSKSSRTTSATSGTSRSQAGRQPVWGSRKTSQSTRRTTTGRASSRQGFHPDPAALLTGLQQASRYFQRPADTIRQSAQYANRRLTFILLAVQSLLGGIALLVASWQPQFAAMLQLTIVSTRQTQPLVSALFIFLQGMGITLIANLLLILIDHLVLRFLYRQPVDFRRLLAGQNPALLYFNLFMLSALLSLPGSLISSLLVLGAGFGIAAIAHFLALRQITGFDENRVFAVMAVVMLLYSSIMAMLFNLALPVLKSLLDQSAVL